MTLGPAYAPEPVDPYGAASPVTQPPNGYAPPLAGSAYDQPQGFTPGYNTGQLQLASWGRRLAARIIDILAFYIPYSAFLFVATYREPIEGGLLVPSVIAGLWLSNRVLLQGLTGQSLGKRVTRTRLVKTAGARPVGIVRALARDLCDVVNWPLFALGFLRAAWNPQGRTFSDSIVRTTVVMVSPLTNLSGQFGPFAKPLSEEHPSYDR